MAGVKVTLLRTDTSDVNPVVRLFEDADGWAFMSDSDFPTLYVTKSGKGPSTNAYGRTNIAWFMASNIESVEFV